MATANVGRVVQIIGPVVDVEFDAGVPAIYNAVRIEDEGREGGAKIDVIVEVEQHLGENRARCVSMLPTDGMVRGMKGIDTGQPISVPVGPGTLGRVMNVIGDPVDEMGPVACKMRYPIHRPAPAFADQSTQLQPQPQQPLLRGFEALLLLVLGELERQIELVEATHWTDSYQVGSGTRTLANVPLGGEFLWHR